MSDTTKSFNAAEAAALVARIKSVVSFLGWRIPFFLPIHARLTYRADTRRPTAWVDIQGNVGFNPAFAATLTDPQLRFVLAHEMMHLVLLHHDRIGGRDPVRWNLAADRIINLTLKQVAISTGDPNDLEMPKVGVLAKDDQVDWTAEQLYAEEPEPSGAARAAFGEGTTPIGAGCGVEPGDPNRPKSPGEGEGDDADGANAPMTETDLRRMWREVAIQAQHQARNAGTVAGNLLADLLELPPPKVRWQEVLRGALHRAIAAAGRDDVSWNRNSRRSTLQIRLPGGITTKCRAAVVIDTSGSMSNDQLARCVAETAAIVNHTNVPVFLVAHDHDVQAVAWIRPGSRGHVGTQIRAQMKGRGGTSFDEAYARVAQEPGRFNTMVHLTDGMVGSWPAKPSNTQRVVVALIDGDVAAVPTYARAIEVEI